MAGGTRAGEPPEPEVRERLRSAAVGLFSSKGYAATTVREIVGRAGVTKPVLYYYFRNKEGIYLDLMRGAMERFGALLNATVEEEGTARERLRRLCLRTYDVFREHLDLARILYAIYYGPPQGAPFVDFEAFHVRFQEAVLRLLEEGARRREFRKGNARDRMWIVIGAVTMALEIELCRPRRSIGRAGIERMLDIIHAGFAPAKGEATGRGKGR